MMPDQRRNQPVRLWAARRHVLERVVTSTVAAGVWFLPRVQLGIDEESVLEIVDPNLRSFRIGDRAQMAGNLESALVCLADRGAQLVTGDVFVCLERGHSPIRPVRNSLAGILWPGQLAHLEVRVIAGSFPIGSRHVQVWSST